MTVGMHEGACAGEFAIGCGDASHRDEKSPLLAQWAHMLSPREMEILNGRFGLHNGESEPVGVLGECLRIGVRRLQQLRREAVTKLKQHRARNGIFKDEAC